MKELEIGAPIATVFLPSITGTLDDHIEGWFLDLDQLPETAPEGLEAVINLGLSEDWLAPPNAPIPPD
jgi:hypothetical protein